MKIKRDFVLRKVADTWVVLPLGAANLDLNGMLTLNETGAFLWRALEQGADSRSLVDALTAEYDVDCTIALEDVEAFLNKLASVGCVE